LWTAVIQHCPPGAVVLAFVGVGAEPDTSGLFELLRNRRCTILLPRVEGEHMVAVAVAEDRPNAALHPGAFGIPEPVGPPVDPATIDIVIVPGLSFTRDGRRLGQGGGFYDRFLPLVRDDCRTIGVCFGEQLVDDLPCEAHDRILDDVVTDGLQE